jgi:hypothetical protein
MPPKLKDPGSFTIPCSLGEIKFKNVLCDLRASVNLMPTSFFETLGIENLKPTKISLQLADGSVRLPIGILKDIPIRVEKIFFPTDFVVINVKKDLHSLILLGHPVLVTAGADINVKSGNFSLNLGKVKIKFVVTKYDKESHDDFYCRVKVVNSPRKEKSIKNVKEELSEAVVRHDDSMNTSGAKDRDFQAIRGNFKITVRIKYFGALSMKRKWIYCEGVDGGMNRNSLSSTYRMDDETRVEINDIK